MIKQNIKKLTQIKHNMENIVKILDDKQYLLSIAYNDLILLNMKWYVRLGKKIDKILSYIKIK